MAVKQLADHDRDFVVVEPELEITHLGAGGGNDQQTLTVVTQPLLKEVRRPSAFQFPPNHLAKKTAGFAFLISHSSPFPVL